MTKLGMNKVACTRCHIEKITMHLAWLFDGKVRLCSNCIEDLYNLEQQGINSYAS